MRELNRGAVMFGEALDLVAVSARVAESLTVPVASLINASYMRAAYDDLVAPAPFSNYEANFSRRCCNMLVSAHGPFAIIDIEALSVAGLNTTYRRDCAFWRCSNKSFRRAAASRSSVVDEAVLASSNARCSSPGDAIMAIAAICPVVTSPFENASATTGSKASLRASAISPAACVAEYFDAAAIAPAASRSLLPSAFSN